MSENGIEYVRVSQASREAAHKPLQVDFDTYEDELLYLRKRKSELELELSSRFSQAAFTLAQQKVRRGSGNTLAEWLRVRSQMESEKHELVTQVKEVDLRFATVKQKAKDEKARIRELGTSSPRERDYPKWALDIVTQLVAIRELLEKSNS